MIVIILFTFCSITSSQQMVIDKNLREVMFSSSVTELHRVFVTFKGRKSITENERIAMKGMSESESQTYYLRALKSFAKERQVGVLDAIKGFENVGKAKLKCDLWSANTISILATNDVIDSLS